MNNFEFLIPITLFFCIAMSIKFIVDGRFRRRLAETHASEELVKAMLAADERARRYDALKWGIVLTALGVSFGIIDLANLDADSPATYGLLIGSAGLGMLGFHILGRKD